MGTQETERVVQHHIDALKAGDLDDVMSDYAADAVIIAGDSVMEGDGIRSLFEGAIASGVFASVEVTAQKAHGEVSFLAFTIPGVIPYGCDTFVVRDGKIVAQTNGIHAG